jgi:hypothetical protein
MQKIGELTILQSGASFPRPELIVGTVFEVQSGISNSRKKGRNISTHPVSTDRAHVEGVTGEPGRLGGFRKEALSASDDQNSAVLAKNALNGCRTVALPLSARGDI